TSLPEGVDLLNAKTGQLMANIPSAVIRGPDEAHYFGGHLWIKNLTPQSFVEINPATGRILNQITSPVPPNAFVVDGDTLWVAADNAPVIVKVALGLDFGGREVARYRLSKDPNAEGGKAMVLVDRSLWVARGDASEVDVVDTATGQVTK